VIVEIELDGRRRAVDARREGAAWVVTIDGRPVSATVSETGGRWSLLLGAPGPAEAGRDVDGPREGGRDVDGPNVVSGFSRTHAGSSRTHASYEVSFEARGNGGLVVHVNGEAIPLTVVNPRTRAGRRGHDGGGSTDANGPVAIVAPMPGRVVKVLVQPGDAVAARQGVVVVEAMKMENELRAPRAGTVIDVRASEGMSVEARAILVVIE
jgi:biotin carboxyl carrier protein